VDEPVPDHLLCPICLDAAPNHVYQCRDGHLLCSGCLDELRARARLARKPPKCPTCRTELPDELNRNRAVEQTIALLPATCRHCTGKTTRGALASHESSCPSAPDVKCAAHAEGCVWLGRESDRVAHQAECALVLQRARFDGDANVLRVWRERCPQLRALWRTGTDVRTWEGVMFGEGEHGAAAGRVVAIDLERKGLTGEVPRRLGRLSELKELNLSNNRLTGSVPAALGQLAALTALNLSNNRLTGLVPAALGRLAVLDVLRLDVNRLSGAVPAALGRLAALEWLFFCNNRLTGSVPAALGQLTALKYLDLSNNQLTGVVPGRARTAHRAEGAVARRQLADGGGAGGARAPRGAEDFDALQQPADGGGSGGARAARRAEGVVPRQQPADGGGAGGAGSAGAARRAGGVEPRRQPADGGGAGGARSARRAEVFVPPQQPADERPGGAHAAAPRPWRTRGVGRGRHPSLVSQ
jgi:hypothetical protein